jgi:hypothetical protein
MPTDTFCVLRALPSTVRPLFHLILHTHTDLFNPGDTRVLEAARQQIRQGFREKASLPADDPSIGPAIQHAEEVAQFLKTNLVQGRKEGDVYSKSPLGCISATFHKTQG